MLARDKRSSLLRTFIIYVRKKVLWHLDQTSTEEIKEKTETNEANEYKTRQTNDDKTRQANDNETRQATDNNSMQAEDDEYGSQVSSISSPMANRK